MNITSVTASISRKAGGLPPSIRRLDQCLNDLPGMRVSVAAMADKCAEQELKDWPPLAVSLSRFYGSHAIGCAPGLMPRMLETEADILHTHGLWQYTSVATSRWHRKTGRPYIVSPHGMLDPWAVKNSGWKKQIALKFYERRHLEEAACIRALCAAEARAIREFGLQNPICIIPNGIDLPPHSRLPAPAWSGFVEPGQKVLLYLGRIHPKKGLNNLLLAWSQIQKMGKPGGKSSGWVMAIAGWDQGGHEAGLKQLCAELQLSYGDFHARQPTAGRQPPATPISVLFLGPQFGEAKATCYANCDAFILPSLSEGLPLVVLEAWAHGKPVVMTPECNLPEGFAAGAALRIEANAENIANQLGGFLTRSESARQKMGRAGLDLVSRQFNWPHLAREMADVCQWLLGNGAKPRCVI